MSSVQVNGDHIPPSKNSFLIFLDQAYNSNVCCSRRSGRSSYTFIVTTALVVAISFRLYGTVHPRGIVNGGHVSVLGDGLGSSRLGFNGYIEKTRFGRLLLVVDGGVVGGARLAAEVVLQPLGGLHLPRLLLLVEVERPSRQCVLAVERRGGDAAVFYT